jgi:1,4-alpha-glucan branching enzyme
MIPGFGLPFILKSGASINYAQKRITVHLARFNYLHESMCRLNERYATA